jgi:periplasmic divalent cation tolerance protein
MMQSAVSRDVGYADECVQVLTTVDNEKKAGEIAESLLRTRAAACVQIIGPIVSSCWWKGQLLRAKEWICVAKARAEDYERVESIIKNVHPYEVPEILAVPVLFGNQAYLAWIRNETAVSRFCKRNDSAGEPISIRDAVV